jgi:hypothetical protein
MDSESGAARYLEMIADSQASRIASRHSRNPESLPAMLEDAGLLEGGPEHLAIVRSKICWIVKPL